MNVFRRRRSDLFPFAAVDLLAKTPTVRERNLANAFYPIEKSEK